MLKQLNKGSKKQSAVRSSANGVHHVPFALRASHRGVRTNCECRKSHCLRKCRARRGRVRSDARKPSRQEAETTFDGLENHGQEIIPTWQGEVSDGAVDGGERTFTSDQPALCGKWGVCPLTGSDREQENKISTMRIRAPLWARCEQLEPAYGIYTKEPFVPLETPVASRGLCLIRLGPSVSAERGYNAAILCPAEEEKSSEARPPPSALRPSVFIGHGQARRPSDFTHRSERAHGWVTDPPQPRLRVLTSVLTAAVLSASTSESCAWVLPRGWMEGFEAGARGFTAPLGLRARALSALGILSGEDPGGLPIPTAHTGRAHQLWPGRLLFLNQIC
ncbi:hypothetical protein AAFF_G00074320 [Aldrovandia affinis]|uniref:Uncharacterized protein n=1 Tax=Aldrovandia affinis TaxID=143900 RepID=A0AAD7RYB5_9TELE|nr:hypothetical protein AAFF_G00074320 [Aldrovandia affinis]